MKRIALVCAVVFAGLASTLLAQGTFRAAIDIVSLNVTVMDASNHYVTDLDEKDFSVFEDGVKQDLSFFKRKRRASRPVDAPRHQRQHGGQAADAAVGRGQLRATG